ncbi:MAG: YgjP-like metallopeptidase domain-containing protein, partial [Sphaerochaetaceae bacterium]
MKTDGKVENISYTLLYRRGCHHITVRVTSNGTVSVSAPYGISKAAVERVIVSNREKLLTTVEKQRNTLHSFQDGEIFFYAGKP